MKRSLLVLLAVLATSGCHARKVRTLEAEVAALEQANRACVIEAEVLQEELVRVERKNRELAAYYESLLDEFGPRMEDGEVELVLYPDRSVLALADEIHFATGSARLSAGGREAVADLARLILRHPDRRFQVEGHTDPRPIGGSYAANWDLGAQRAVNVVKALIEAGVPEDQLSAATYAATSPVAANDSPDGMARNRRIAVALQTTLEETAAHQALLERAREHRVARVVGARDGRTARN